MAGRRDHDRSDVISLVTGDGLDVPHSEILVPRSYRIQTINGESCLTFDMSHGDERVVRNDAHVVRDFARLANPSAKDDQFVQFAERYGPLFLCSTHKLAPLAAHGDIRDDAQAWHSNPARTLSPLAFFLRAIPYGEGKHQCALSLSEPLSIWRERARELRAAVRVIRALCDQRVGNVDDWEALFPRHRRGPLSSLSKPVADAVLDGTMTVGRARERIEMVVHHWIQMGAVRLHYSFREDRPAVTIEGAGVLGMLARQLMLATDRARGGRLLFLQSVRKSVFYREWQRTKVLL